MTVLPSGDNNFYDLRQSIPGVSGDPINLTFPSPDLKSADPNTPSGVLLETYEPKNETTSDKGVLHFDFRSSEFSNASSSYSVQISSDLSVFYDYIHYQPVTVAGRATYLRLPYISDVTVTQGLPISVYYTGN